MFDYLKHYLLMGLFTPNATKKKYYLVLIIRMVEVYKFSHECQTGYYEHMNSRLLLQRYLCLLPLLKHLLISIFSPVPYQGN